MEGGWLSHQVTTIRYKLVRASYAGHGAVVLSACSTPARYMLASTPLRVVNLSEACISALSLKCGRSAVGSFLIRLFRACGSVVGMAVDRFFDSTNPLK
jgi:hypothetical protein